MRQGNLTAADAAKFPSPIPFSPPWLLSYRRPVAVAYLARVSATVRGIGLPGAASSRLRTLARGSSSPAACRFPRELGRAGRSPCPPGFGFPLPLRKLRSSTPPLIHFRPLTGRALSSSSLRIPL